MGQIHRKTMQSKRLTLAEKANLSTTFTKSPVFDLTAEKVVLRALINTGEWFATVQDIINEQCFYSADHKKLFRAMQTCYKKSGSVDMVNISEQLGATDEALSLILSISSFTTSLSDSGFMPHHHFVQACKALRRQYISREGVRIQNKYLYLWSKPEQLKNMEKLISEYYAEVQKFMDLATAEDNEKPTDILNDLIDDILNPIDEIRGLPTGIDELDKTLNGLSEGELITFIATPGTGKTAMMLSVLIHLVFTLDKPCIFVSYEMTLKQLLRRILSSLTAIESWRLGTRDLEQHERTILDTMTDKIYTALDANKLIFVDGIGKNSDQLHAQLMVLKQKHNAKAMFVDYLNKIPSANKRANKNQKLADASEGLKNIALKLQVPVVTAAQVDKDTGKTPQPPNLYSIRDASEVGDDSYKVISIFRPELHGLEDWNGMTAEELQGLTVFTVLKNRDGSTGQIQASFEKEITKFKNHTGYIDIF
jgi:replicative DNA helicase